jgi:hypothetical protein
MIKRQGKEGETEWKGPQYATEAVVEVAKGPQSLSVLVDCRYDFGSENECPLSGVLSVWPFSKRPRVDMSAWTFLPNDDEHTVLSLAPGKWVVTDGAYFTKDSVAIGPIVTHDGFLDLSLTPDGLELLSFGYRVEAPVAKRATKILVIDSGDMVFSCEDALKRSGITMSDHRTSYAFGRTCLAFEKAARLAGKRSNTLLIHDSNRLCIAISARPMWGDGAYRLEFDKAGEFQLLRAHLGESC